MVKTKARHSVQLSCPSLVNNPHHQYRNELQAFTIPHTRTDSATEKACQPLGNSLQTTSDTFIVSVKPTCVCEGGKWGGGGKGEGEGGREWGWGGRPWGVGNGKQSDKLKNSKQTWCLTSTETIRLIGAGEKGGGGGGGREGMWRGGGENTSSRRSMSAIHSRYHTLSRNSSTGIP